MGKEKQTQEKANFLKRLERLKNQDVYFRHSTGKISGSIVEVNEEKDFVLIREKNSKEIKKIEIQSIDRGSLAELKMPM